MKRELRSLTVAEIVLLVLIVIATGAVLMIGLFQRGLFFPGDLLPVQAAFFFLFLCWCILKLLQRDTSLLRTPLDWCLLVLLFCYFLSFFAAVDKRAALGEFLTTAMYFSVYLMILDISGQKPKVLDYFHTISLLPSSGSDRSGCGSRELGYLRGLRG